MTRKTKLLGQNAARIFNIEIPAARRAIAQDLLYRLRDDGNPLPTGIQLKPEK